MSVLLNSSAQTFAMASAPPVWTQARSAEFLDALPAAVFTIDSQGLITGYNARAAELWGRKPICGDTQQRFCGSFRLFLPDGTWVPHDQCPMAQILKDGLPVKDLEVLMERPDGTRITVLVNIVPLHDEHGSIIGAMNCFNDISSRKRIEEELLRRQQDLDDFFENGAVALHWVAADGTILRANRAELDLLGYHREEYVGRQIADFHADRSAIDEILTCLSRGERLDKYPARLRAKDGTIKHVLITSNVQFRDGKFVHTRCFTLDVTEAHLAQEALRKRERWLHELLDSLPVALYTTDAAGRITYYNQAAVDLAGRRPALGTDEWCVTWRLYYPDGTPLPHNECPMAIALKEDRPIRGVEAVAERPDGTRVPFMPYPTPLHDASGALVGAVNMLMDLTEVKHVAQAAYHLAAIVESSDDAIISKDLNGIIKTWNAGAQRLFGYTAEEVVGKSIMALIPPDRHNEEQSIIACIRAGERVKHYETMRRHKDGHLIDVSLTISPVKNATGEIIGASKIVRDITERKQAETRMRLLTREVDHRAKNMLATVQAIARMTQAESVPAYAETLIGRIQALARVHTLLAASRWVGADLKRLAVEELSAFGIGKRVEISGPPVALSPEGAQGFALVLHELATNAAKYGALSTLSGHLSVVWSWNNGNLLLRWSETGGPEVHEPSGKGFGMTLMKATAKTQFEGTVRFDWRRIGLVCEIEVSLDKLTASADTGLDKD